MKNIKQLEKELKQKREEEYKIRKKKEHIARQMDKCLDNEKKFSKYYIESLRLEKIYKNIRIEIAVIEGDLKIEAATIKDRKYKKDFISFRLALIEDFQTFLDLLNKGQYQLAFEQIVETESQYRIGSKEFLIDLKSFETYLSFPSIKTYMSTILSRTGKALRLKGTFGDSVSRGYAGKTLQTVGLVHGIIESAMQLLEGKKDKKKKIKEKQPKKKEDQKKKENISQPKEEPKHDTALEKAVRRFKESRAKGEV